MKGKSEKMTSRQMDVRLSDGRTMTIKSNEPIFANASFGQVEVEVRTDGKA